ncbi:MAG: hypothetical protein WC030_02430 [Candidatus Paceibacterota bacterium]
MKTTFIQRVATLVATALLFGLAGCAAIDAGGTIRKDAAALHGDYSGEGFSGAVSVVRLPGDIPGVPESAGKTARWSQIEVEQVLYLDADCQRQLFDQLPGWAQAIAKEGGWSALAVAVGQVGFAAAFPGADLARYFLAGLGYGFPAGANTGRYRQDGAEKSAQGYCVVLNAWEAKKRYGILAGINFTPWHGNGHTTLPKAQSAPATQPLPKATEVDDMGPPIF